MTAKKETLILRIDKVPVPLRNKFKGICAMTNVSMREAIIQLMERFVDEHANRNASTSVERRL